MSKHSELKGPTQRQLRVGEMIRHAFTDILMRLEFMEDGLDSHSVTITEVRVSPDLRNATIYTLPFGAADAGKLREALSRHQKYFRGELAKRVNLKYMPNLSFQIDDSFDKAKRIDELLQSPAVKRDIG
ncbi:MAG: 30S ribosome-binding factor RbfA [Hyphomicrobiales bacterium]|nr:30S ribosome-binding factor RbfA [Hyphomicrobiales bacterium]